MLSKVMDSSKKPGPVRSASSLIDDGVTFMGGLSVEKIDYNDKKVVLSNK